jgi:hypothetical protein
MTLFSFHRESKLYVRGTPFFVRSFVDVIRTRVPRELQPPIEHAAAREQVTGWRAFGAGSDDALMEWLEDPGEHDWEALVAARFFGRTVDELRRRLRYLDVQLLRVVERTGFEDTQTFWREVARRWPSEGAATRRGWEAVRRRYNVLIAEAGV